MKEKPKTTNKETLCDMCGTKIATAKFSLDMYSTQTLSGMFIDPRRWSFCHISCLNDFVQKAQSAGWSQALRLLTGGF